LDFSISKEQQFLLNTVEKISRNFPKQYWEEKYRKRSFPVEYWKAFADFGFFGFLVPEHLSGLGKKFLDFVLCIEKAAEAGAGTMAYILLSSALVSEMFDVASQRLREEIVPKLASGSIKISIALAEDGSGQDVRSIRSRVVRETSNSYELSGNKIFVSNADISDFILLFANFTNNSHQELTLFLVNSSDARLLKSEQEKLGYDPLRMYSLTFENLVVEKSRKLWNDKKKGSNSTWKNSLRVFAMDRVATAALLCGTAKLAIYEAVEYSKQRKVFAKQIGANQAIQFPLAEAYANVEASKHVAYKAAWAYDTGRSDFSTLGAMALSKALRSALASTDAALQCFGGHGYLNTCGVQRYWKDVRASTVHPISKELLTAMIAERALGLPKSY
jgi:acyl-CoA dehydrogenase